MNINLLLQDEPYLIVEPLVALDSDLVQIQEERGLEADAEKMKEKLNNESMESN